MSKPQAEMRLPGTVWAQRIARAGPSKVARTPSPVVLTTGWVWRFTTPPDKAPRTWYTLQFVLPTIIELYAGADHQVLNRARRYDFIGSGRVCHASGDVHGLPATVVAPSLDLSRVYARPNAEPEVVL